MRKVLDVVMLSTEKASQMWVIGGTPPMLMFDRNPLQKETNVDLFFLSDDKIEFGNLIINMDKYNDGFGSEECLVLANNGYRFDDLKKEIRNGANYKKVVASSDPTQEFWYLPKGGMTSQYDNPLALIPQSFLHIFVKEYYEGNQISEVMVDYAPLICRYGREIGLAPKVREDNTVIVHKSENVMAKRLEDTPKNQLLVDEVFEQIMMGGMNGDYKVLEEILKNVPKKVLINSLPEESGKKYKD